MPEQSKPFQFEISLSVLNHLGRNLYRNFITVLGEAISNAWDADANNVWIYINKDNNNFIIKDDGVGMDASDFQDKFLKVGYSKRKDGKMSSQKGRPYIGAKGIGKLALLSCAKKISIISKTSNTDYVGGVIDNTGLDEAIKKEMKPDEYPLENFDIKSFSPYTQYHKNGTIIKFEQINDNIKNTIPYLKKLIALYFRFSLIDKNFNIFVNKNPITLDDLEDLSGATEFLWNINNLKDIYVSNYLSKLKENKTLSFPETTAKGFIASVNRPRFLKITGTEEKAGVDLFVNGRLREKNILKHLPDFSTRHVASYLYGQIHFDQLDRDTLDKVFTSSREGVVADNSEFAGLLEVFKQKILEHISDEWDEWRLKHKKEGDSENIRRMSAKERNAKSLVETTFDEFTPPKSARNKNILDSWINELIDDARFNVSSYADCFISENLIRKYIQEKKVSLTKEAKVQIDAWKKAEMESKNKGNISINIMENCNDLSYLSMDGLANLIDKKSDQNLSSLSRDAKAYKPMRNAVAHTARLTQIAKYRLNLVYENIKGRLKTLLFDDNYKDPKS